MNIGVFMQTSFHYFVYEPVIDELLKNEEVEDVILVINDLLNSDSEWYKMFENLVVFIRKLKRNDMQAVFLSDILNNNYKFDCMLSLYFNEYIQKISNFNIRLMYSLAKEDWTFADWNKQYNLILCYGDYDYAKLNTLTQCLVVGNPKFDKWVNESGENGKKEKKYKLNINDDKETILYAPTYGDLSSIDKWLDIIYDLSDNYNVIIKLHHGTNNLVSEERRRNDLENLFTNIYGDDINLLDLIEASDFILSDNSGIIYEAAIALKKIILLDNSNLANQLNLPSVNNFEDLLRALKNVNYPTKTLEHIREEYFYEVDGKAGKRAARGIIEQFNSLLLTNKEN
ncbi:hypothetical protein NCCP2716_19080 [Sporosarcina sp. NCCP-2716]|uniref:CDP-glycerol glycerophosphotransferase family protein n=1 Tax=Sporosarcina sp. NCCP-2716 TaxID=2943679 RepID=UPI00203C2832|nr:CDP-glycerol glycerophosphotransferase family protein [Sporosarcina sp. NCCP-2716]GKV69410.1 hypothetical protein NCCP2716_19080 [Sporosarcina sp. NCCP-2716]